MRKKKRGERKKRGKKDAKKKRHEGKKTQGKNDAKEKVNINKEDKGSSSATKESRGRAKPLAGLKISLIFEVILEICD